MPSSLLQIRRSPAATVDAAIPAEGELAYKTDTKKLSIGDGSTLGGNGIVMDSQLATDTLAGIVEKATTAEAKAATANKFPDAAGVKSYVDQFGIGSSAMTLITDANSLNKTGIYRTGATWTGSVHTAGSGSNQGVLYHAEAYTGFTYSTQLWMRMQNTEMYIRHENNSVWSEWSKVYLNTNIVGTVSQSSGVPTGAIIEQGSNANGRYIKYADGTMICTGAITLNLTITTATGSVFVSTAAATVTYPTTFAATPTHFIVSQSASSSAWISATSPSSTTAGTVYLMASTSRAAQGYSATFLAIGRWY